MIDREKDKQSHESDTNDLTIVLNFFYFAPGEPEFRP